jgi:sugar phosphate isomerase/epimerase
VRLGLSMACFRWEIYPDLQRTRPEYLAAGHPPLFFSSVPVALPLDQGGLEWLIDYSANMTISALYMWTERLRDAGFAAAIRERAEEHTLELILAASFDWCSVGDVAEKERERFVEKMKIARSMGIGIVNATHGAPLTTNHFTRDPPIEQQIEHMVDNFARLARLAEEMGIIIAMENHADYRCSEIRRVLETVDSPSLRANFDTGNPINVVEDPVEAAKAVAPYAIVSHLKDYRIVNTTMLDGTPRIFHAPTGMGDIDMAQILDILQRNAPDPTNLRLCIETVPPLDVDPGLWVDRCIANTRKMFSSYLV